MRYSRFFDYFLTLFIDSPHMYFSCSVERKFDLPRKLINIPQCASAFREDFRIFLDGVKLCFVAIGEGWNRKGRTRCKVREKDKNGERQATHARRWAPLNFRFKCGIEVASQTAWGGHEKLKSKSSTSSDSTFCSTFHLWQMRFNRGWSCPV